MNVQKVYSDAVNADVHGDNDNEMFISCTPNWFLFDL